MKITCPECGASWEGLIAVVPTQHQANHAPQQPGQATPKQLAWLAKYKVAHPEKLSKWEASKIIGEALLKMRK